MFRDLRTQILLWTIVPLVALLVVIAYIGVNSHQTAMRDLVEERDSAQARVAAARVSEALANHQAILQALANTDPATLTSQRTLFDGGFAPLDARGNIISAEPSNEAWQARHRDDARSEV